VRQFILYGTSACHLCELAEAMLEAHPELGRAFSYRKSDISESDELFERYGLLIPVLREEGLERELHWPFEPGTLHAFLGGAAD
jgi:hypothetical protein